jgi:sialic acid synthase SpsE
VKTFIIAEIGSAWRFGKSHMLNAQQAIQIAKDCGAHIVKFQWVSDPRKMEKRRKVKKGSYTILAWPEKWIERLYNICFKVGIEFMCTTFLTADVKSVSPYVSRFKVASLESDSPGFLQCGHDLYRVRLTHIRTEMKCGEIGNEHLYFKPLIISRGACTSYMDDYPEKSYNLHCTIAYPCPLEGLNLKAISHRGYDGLSDHSADVMTGALAVACGAKIIEVHFRLGRTPKNNPDYNHSHSPEQLKQYIDNIKKAELMLGDGIKKVEPCEEWALKHKVRT